MQHRKPRTSPSLLALLLVVALAGAVAAAEPLAIGVAYSETGLGGTESVGSELNSGELFHARHTGAVVRLDNGHVLRLAPGSSAIFETGADGDIGVRLLAGRLAAVDARGRAMLAGAGSRFTLSPTIRDAVAAEDRLLLLDMAASGREARESDDSRERQGRRRGLGASR